MVTWLLTVTATDCCPSALNIDSLSPITAMLALEEPEEADRPGLFLELFLGERILPNIFAMLPLDGLFFLLDAESVHLSPNTARKSSWLTSTLLENCGEWTRDIQPIAPS
jgi:hypothetical protein